MSHELRNQEIIKMFREHTKQVEIAKVFNVSPSVVRDVIRKYIPAEERATIKREKIRRTAAKYRIKYIKDRKT